MSELAQPGPDTSLLRTRRAEHRANEARIRFWRVVIVTSFFAVLIGGSLLAGAVAVIGSMKNQARVDAAARHATAKISRPMVGGVFCHSLVFDNNSAQSIEDKVEPCDKDRITPKSPSQTKFVWGGK
jgi:hypothetical protein